MFRRNLCFWSSLCHFVVQVCVRVRDFPVGKEEVDVIWPKSRGLGEKNKSVYDAKMIRFGSSNIQREKLCDNILFPQEKKDSIP